MSFKSEGTVLSKLSVRVTVMLTGVKFCSGPGQFSYPQGICADAQGDIYVTDTSNSRVQKFTSAGVFLEEWGAFGTGDGQLNYNAQGIAVDSQGAVYVADEMSDRVQRFAEATVSVLGFEGTEALNGGTITHEFKLTTTLWQPVADLPLALTMSRSS